MPSAKRNSSSNTPKKSAETPTKNTPKKSTTTPNKVKQKKNLDQESSIIPKKRKAPEPSPDVTPVKSQKRNTPLKKKQKYEAESPLSTPQKADSSVKLVRFHDAEIEIIEDIKQPQKTSKKPDLEKICEDDDDEETFEAFSMYGKYGRAVKKKVEEDDDPTFGFATPKKNSMIDRTNLVLSAIKKTPVSKALERLTPRKKSQPTTPISKPTTPKSQPTTPTSSRKNGAAATMTPLSKLKLRGDAPETPKSVRKRISKKIEQKLESSSSEEEESDEEEADSEDEEIKPIDKMAANRTGVDTDDFFEKQGSKEITTSDKTLAQLKTPRLSPELLRDILQNEPLKYAKEIELLNLKYQKLFHKWIHLLNEGFNVLLYGFGSKRTLLNDLHSTMLNEKDCVVINGFFPSLTMKHVLGVILNDILEFEGSIGSSLVEQAESIFRAYTGDSVADDLYLIVHNVDGPMLRNEVSQGILSRLASHPRIHFICSSDHVNAPLLWDQHKLSNFNFVWQDASTFLPYFEETLNENSLMVRSGGTKLALHSLMRVFESLTPNAKEIYLLIINEQMKAVEEQGLSFYQGLSFKDLYRRCRRAFLVNSDLTLRAQLTEFIDHKLIRNKNSDGMDYLLIPLENSTLQEFIEKYKTTM